MLQLICNYKVQTDFQVKLPELGNQGEWEFPQRCERRFSARWLEAAEVRPIASKQLAHKRFMIRVG